MKGISPVWFLKDPIEIEHKSYVLLDQLKKYNEEIQNNNVYSTLNDVFDLINDIKFFSKNGDLPKSTIEKLNKEELSILEYHRRKKDSVEFNNLDSVIESMISILYRYANIGINVLKEKGPAIRKFEIIPEIGFHRNPEFAILFIRNMEDSKVIPFIWDSKNSSNLVEIEVDAVEYSMSYVYLAHEIIDRTAVIEKGTTPRIFVCEISDFIGFDMDIIESLKKSLLQHIKKEIKGYN